MEGDITARTLDYPWLLVDASAWTLVSAIVTAICVKFEQRWPARFFAVSFFGSALAAAYCLEKLL